MLSALTKLFLFKIKKKHASLFNIILKKREQFTGFSCIEMVDQIPK
jgi:hypothetical protein